MLPGVELRPTVWRNMRVDVVLTWQVFSKRKLVTGGIKDLGPRPLLHDQLNVGFYTYWALANR